MKQMEVEKWYVYYTLISSPLILSSVTEEAYDLQTLPTDNVRVPSQVAPQSQARLLLRQRFHQEAT